MDSSPTVTDTVQSDSDDDMSIAELVQANLVRNLSTFLEKQRGLAMFACGGVVPITQSGTLHPTADLGDAGTGKKPAEDATKPDKKKNEKKNQEKNKKKEPATVEQPATSCVSPPITLRWDATDDNMPCKNTKLNFPLDDATAQNLEHLLAATAPASFGRGGEDVYDETYRKALKLDTTKFCSTFNPYELGIIDTIAQLLLPSTIDSRTHRAVRAELYKLNVYSGPFGKFKPHVDTPRSQFQFGSLVVCLPIEHEGGQLIVRHKGKDFTFDFSTAADDKDHASIRWAAFYSDCEHEVREVTSGHRVTLTYNLYAVRGNGSLTGYCPTLDPSHLPLYHSVEALLQDKRFMEDGGWLGVYCNHAYAYTSEAGDFLPDTLKGLDMVVWETFKALGGELFIKPVIMAEWDDEGLEEDHRFDAVVGNNLKIDFGDQVEDDDGRLDLYNDWKTRLVDYADISWLNSPAYKELQLFYTAYGNEASVACEYSHCAILVRILPFESRRIGSGLPLSAVG